jgi:hypothetical protein
MQRRLGITLGDRLRRIRVTQQDIAVGPGRT